MCGIVPRLPFSHVHRTARVRDSAFAHPGLGAFATRAIPAGTRLIEYAGERLTPEQADARYPDVIGERHHTFLFAIDDDVMIDAAVGGNDARFINHSCDPNCDAVVEDGRIWIDTIRDIEPGEELAYDYAYVLEERHTPGGKTAVSVQLRRTDLPRNHSREEAVIGVPSPAFSRPHVVRPIWSGNLSSGSSSTFVTVLPLNSYWRR